MKGYCSDSSVASQLSARSRGLGRAGVSGNVLGSMVFEEDGGYHNFSARIDSDCKSSNLSGLTISLMAPLDLDDICRVWASSCVLNQSLNF